MNKTVSFSVLAVVSIVMIIASVGLSVSDFIAGLVLGLGISLAVIAIYGLTTSLKKKSDK